MLRYTFLCLRIDEKHPNVASDDHDMLKGTTMYLIRLDKGIELPQREELWGFEPHNSISHEHSMAIIHLGSALNSQVTVVLIEEQHDVDV